MLNTDSKITNFDWRCCCDAAAGDTHERTGHPSEQRRSLYQRLSLSPPSSTPLALSLQWPVHAPEQKKFSSSDCGVIPTLPFYKVFVPILG